MTLLPNHCAWGTGRAGGSALHRRLTPQSLGRGREGGSLLFCTKASRSMPYIYGVGWLTRNSQELLGAQESAVQAKW